MVDNEKIKKDFRYLLYVIWRHQGLREPSWLQYDMAEYMQYGPNRSIVEAMRGAGKSWMACAFACWWLNNHPNDQVLVVSASSGKASDFSHLIRRWIETIPCLTHLRPKDNDRNNINKFDVGSRSIPGASASVTSYGITGQITGGRANLIIPDDTETLDNAATIDQRIKLRLKWTEFDSIIHPGGKILGLGTPQTEASLYNELEGPFTIRRWPARYPDLADEFGVKWVSPKIIRRLQEGKATVGLTTFPERYDDEELATREASMGKSQFRLQYLLDTSLSDEDKYPLKLRDFVVMGCNRERAPVEVTWASGKQQRRDDIPSVGIGRNDYFYGPMAVSSNVLPYTEAILQIDPAGRGGDELSYAIGKFLNGNIYVLKSNGLLGGFSPENLSIIAQDAWDYDVHQIRAESNWGGGMFTQLLRPVVYRLFESKMTTDGNPRLKTIPEIPDDVKVKGQKEQRIIRSLEPLMNQHRVIVDESVAKDTTLMYQVSHITKERGALEKDDRVDVFSQLCEYFTDKIGIQQEAYIKNLEEQQLKDELARFHDDVRFLRPQLLQKPNTCLSPWGKAPKLSNPLIPIKLR